MGPGKFIGTVTQRLTAPLHYIGARLYIFFRVGLCPHGNYLCMRRGDMAGVGCGQDDGDRVDQSPRDHQSSTYANWGLSDAIKGLTLGHVASRESLDRHQMKTAR